MGPSKIMKSGSEIEVSKPCGAVSTRWMSVFIPGLLEFYMYRRTSDPGMGPYHFQVRRDLAVVPWGSSCRTLAERELANCKSASWVGGSTPCGAVSTQGCPFSSPRCWSCRSMEGFLIQRWDLVASGCDVMSTLSRGTSLGARWLHV